MSTRSANAPWPTFTIAPPLVALLNTLKWSLWYFRPGTRDQLRLGPLDRSSCRDGSSIDHVLHARDGRGTRRGEKRNEVGDFERLCGPPQRNAAQRLHDDLLASFEISPGLL